MELQTPRLILRPFRADDLDRLAELMANPEFMRFSLGPYTREQTQTILAEISLLGRSWFAFAVRSYSSRGSRRAGLLRLPPSP